MYGSDIPSRRRTIRPKRNYGSAFSNPGYTSASARPFKRPRRSLKSVVRNRNIRTGGFLGIEYKFVDSSYNAIIPTVNALPTGLEADPVGKLCLNAIAQGDGENERDGRQVVMKYVHIQGSIDVIPQSNASAYGDLGPIYLAVVLDKQTNAAQCNSEDVFIATGVAGGDICKPFRNLQYVKRFQILKSIVIQPPFNNGSWRTDNNTLINGGMRYHFELHVPLNNIKVNYSNNTAVVASIVDNSIHVMAARAGNETINLQYISRLRFVG